MAITTIERIQMLKERLTEHAVHELHYPLKTKACIERARYMTQSFKQTEGEPMVIRRAKALANYLEKKTLFVTEGELITGHVGKDANSVPFYCDIQSADRIKADVIGQEMLTEDEWKELDEILAYWQGKTLEEICLRAFPEEVKRLVYPPDNWRQNVSTSYQAGVCALCPDHEMLLSIGLKEIMKRVEAKLAELNILKAPSEQLEEILNKIDTLNAMLIAGKGAIKFAQRYSQLAKELAEKESDPSRKAELEQIAENCGKVIAEPAGTFWQALQTIWFVHMIDHVFEGPGISLGQRLDQILLLYYRRDIEAGRLTREKAQELLENLWLKFEREIVHLKAQAERVYVQGGSLYQNVTICGVDENGNDATNELSYLILDTTKSVRTVQPTLTLRYHDGISDDILVKAWETVITGVGMPAFFNEKTVIPHMINRGATLKDARNNTVMGCMAILVPGKNIFSKEEGIVFFNMAKCLELALNDGVDALTGTRIGPKTGDPRKFRTFEDVVEAFRKQEEYALNIGNIANQIYRIKQAELLHRPFSSLLVKSAIERAEDVTQYEDYDFCMVNSSGGIDTADSLAAIKKLVFDEKKVTWDRLHNALKADFEGYEDIRRLCLEAPKWGNDDDYVDNITRDIFNLHNSEVEKLIAIHGAHHSPVYQSAGSWVKFGMGTAALPSGRKAGRPLSDGGVSPEAGFGVDPVKVVKSVSKLDTTRPIRQLLNQRLSPSTTARQFVNFIRGWGDLGLSHTQFNVFDEKTLRDAQAHPEKYPDLVVRVAGYSVHFIHLPRETQDAIITRCQQSLSLA